MAPKKKKKFGSHRVNGFSPSPSFPFPPFPFPPGELIDLGEVRRWQRSEENPQKRGKQLLHRSRVRASWLHFSCKGNRSVPYVTAKLSGAAKCGRGERERGNFHKIDPSKSQRHKRVGERGDASSFFPFRDIFSSEEDLLLPRRWIEGGKKRWSKSLTLIPRSEKGQSHQKADGTRTYFVQ